MTTTLEQLNQFNEQFDREEYLYTVQLCSFKKWNDGKYHHNGGEDTVFCLTNDLEEAKKEYKKACDHADLGREYYLVSLSETVIDDSDAYLQVMDGMEFTNIPNSGTIEW